MVIKCVGKKHTAHIYVSNIHSKISINNLLSIDHFLQDENIELQMAFFIQQYIMDTLLYTYPISLMPKMLFRNLFATFQSEITNCDPQPIVLNMKKFHIHFCFSSSLKNQVRVMHLQVESFQPSSNWPSGWRMHPLLSSSCSPQFPTPIHTACISC